MKICQHQIRKGDRDHAGSNAARYAKQGEEDQLSAMIFHPISLYQPADG